MQFQHSVRKSSKRSDRTHDRQSRARLIAASTSGLMFSFSAARAGAATYTFTDAVGLFNTTWSETSFSGQTNWAGNVIPVSAPDTQLIFSTNPFPDPSFTPNQDI